MKKAFLFILILSGLWPMRIYAQTNTGTIKGKVINRDTQEPLIGVNVMVRGTSRGAATGKDGVYVIAAVPSGSYTLEFHYIGFDKLIRTDVIVRSGRITFVHAELKESALTTDEVVVTAGFFPSKESQPQGVVGFNGEEVRRSPAAGGDVSRIMAVLPSVAQVADNVNDLAVRGGSPSENAFYIDHIPVPNINHFPVQGSSGGPIGLINTDLIEEVTFYTGGFSALYGDRLSSVMNIRFREGNRDEYDGQVDLSMGGFGGLIEGPMFEKKGSFIFSLRRSYLDWIVEAIGTGAIPKYGDLHGKIVYDISPSHQLTFLSVTGISTIHFDRKDAEKSGNPGYGKSESIQTVGGFNWKSLWSSSLLSNTSFSLRRLGVRNKFFFTKNDHLYADLHSAETAGQIRHTTTWLAGSAHRLEWGGELMIPMENYDHVYGAFTNRLGDSVPGLTVKQRFRSLKTGLFLSYSWTPVPVFTLTTGLRGDYYHYNRHHSISPRISALWRLTPRMNVYAAWGMYYQNLPMIILSQDPAYKKLRDPHAMHTVIGTDYLLTEDTKLTTEIYLKNYDRFPMMPSDPTLFVIDEGNSMSHFQKYFGLVDKGKAQTYGIEVIAQKKLAQNFYGLISAAYFRSRYRDLNGKWHARVYDNRYLFNVVGGYKPNPRWEFSVRWVFAGGIPYTPFDLNRSRLMNSGIIDSSQINAKRYPDYHALNIRFDRRVYFKHSALVTYLMLYNAYNRKNIAAYIWNETKNKPHKLLQWSLIPVGGLEYEF